MKTLRHSHTIDISDTVSLMPLKLVIIVTIGQFKHHLNESYFEFSNSAKDSQICYFLVFLAKLSFPTTVLLNKTEAVKVCKMFSNGTLPYERSHVNSLNEENLTFGLFPSKSPRAPIQAWFGATLDSDRREYISDLTGKVTKTYDQKFFHSNYWLYMNVKRPSFGSIYF